MGHEEDQRLVAHETEPANAADGRHLVGFIRGDATEDEIDALVEQVIADMEAEGEFDPGDAGVDPA